MALLLDTHFAFALAGAPIWISRREEEFLAAHPDPFVVSAVSLWEMRLKWNSYTRDGERRGPTNPQTALAFLQTLNVELLPLSPQHAAARLETPLPHKDPFDELLLVQAQVEGHRLLTRDKLLKQHPLAHAI